MNYFERKRRQLFKNHYVHGSKKTVSGIDSILVSSSAGVPFKSLSIDGVSKTERIDVFPEHSEYFKNIQNYEWGQISYTYVIPFPSDWIGKELIFSLVEKTKITDITFELTDDPGILGLLNSEKLLDLSGNTREVTSSAFSYFKFTCIMSENLKEISDFWQSYTLSVKLPIPEIKCVNSQGMKISLSGDGFDLKITAPKSVTIGGKEVPIVLSEWDKLMVDGANKRVIYTQGSLYKEFKNGSEITLHSWASNNGHGNNYIWQKYYHGADIKDVGYCNYFPKEKMNWNTLTTFENVFATYSYEGYIVFRTDGKMTLAEFRNWIEERYNEGKPLTILVERVEPVEYDITDTDFGRELLSLVVPPGKDAQLTISGALDGAPIGLVYYSTREADKVKITIKYIDKNGNEIKEPRVSEVRQGSKYLIVAPHIDGYKRVSSEVYGVADADSEIELIYQKG